MIHQFIHNFAQPKYWIDEKEGRKAVLGRNGVDEGQILDYQCYRLGVRAIGRNTDIRTLIVGNIPKNVFCGNSILVLSQTQKISNLEVVYLQGILNSFVVDFALRQTVTANVNMFYIYQTPIPRLTEGDLYFQDIVERAGKLICTSAEYDDLAQEIGLKSHQNGVTNKEERENLRAEIDSIVAHLYGLNEVEFKHILSTFPIVEERIKEKTLKAFLEFKGN
ncbi:hypothetical protein ACN4EE_15725 [Geminocystis sp. CENA526]|uniref:hypothetical protein n=1 Tax=Geminocystis sp. CENA526 TaxID=1355871 RepID=UPI003D6E3E78